jgi:hypothetical protein
MLNRLVLGSLMAALLWISSAYAYVEIPYTLGRLITESTHVMLVQVDKVDKTKNLIIYRKIKDIKGTHPTDVIKHNIGQAGFSPREWQTIMKWAEPGKMAVFMHNGGASETCIDGYWYQAYANGEWWGMSHGEPYMNRSYAGKPEKLGTLVAQLLEGKEVVTSCMVDGDKNALQNGTAKIQRLKASLKVQDYNPVRDFLGWGGNEDFRKLLGMPGFTHLCELPRVDPGACGIAPADFDGNGKMDFCLYGDSRVCLLQNDGKAVNEFSLPYTGGARSASWADHNGDGKPDLLLATPSGPKLLTNAGETFKDETGGLPLDPYYNLSGAVWADVDADKRPDIVLANGILGWRVYRNLGPEAPAKPTEPAVGKWFYAGPFDNLGGAGFDAKYAPEERADLNAEYTGRGGAKFKWKEGAFKDGEVNHLGLFGNNDNFACYLYREYNVAGSANVPCSLGSDDTLTVWFNGQKVVSENVYRACAPDTTRVTLNFKPGKNTLLMKICQGSGPCAFYFKCDAPKDAVSPLFADVTEKYAPATDPKTLISGNLYSADFNNDGRTDLLLTGQQTILALATPQGFKPAAAHGLQFDASGNQPAIGDFDGDKLVDIFVPSSSGSRLYKNAGQGKFLDVTAKSGDLAKIANASSAAWADLDNRGKPGLLVGCIKGPNRYLRIDAGKFSDATEELGLQQKVFNSKAVSAIDLNGDGVNDVLFNNEAQASIALLGNAERVKDKK